MPGWLDEIKNIPKNAVAASMKLKATTSKDIINNYKPNYNDNLAKIDNTGTGQPKIEYVDFPEKTPSNNDFLNLIYKSEGLEPNQTPFRYTNNTMRNWNSIHGFPVNKNAIKGDKRQNFIYLQNNDDVLPAIKKQWMNYQTNPKQYGLNDKSTLGDALKVFDQTGSSTKFKMLKDSGIDTNILLKDYKFKEGGLLKYPNGGTPPKSIIVSDPKDIRLQMYNDSLSLYNYDQLQRKYDTRKDLRELSVYEQLFGGDKFTDVGKQHQNELLNIAKNLIKSSPNLKIGLDSMPVASLKDYAENGSTDIYSPNIKPKGEWMGTGKNSDYSNVKPVQPVIYQPKSTPILPPKSNQPTYEDSLKLYNFTQDMLSKYPQKHYYSAEDDIKSNLDYIKSSGSNIDYRGKKIPTTVEDAKKDFLERVKTKDGLMGKTVGDFLYSRSDTKYPTYSSKIAPVGWIDNGVTDLIPSYPKPKGSPTVKPLPKDWLKYPQEMKDHYNKTGQLYNVPKEDNIQSLPQKNLQEVIKPISNTLPKPKKSIYGEFIPGYVGSSPYGYMDFGDHKRAATYQEYIKHGSQKPSHVTNWLDEMK